MILPPRPSPPRRGFTLVELLIVMGVIGVLAVLTLVSVKAITADARLSSATNTVTAALANARATAMKKNQIVVIVFRPQFVGTREQAVEIVTAEWTGQSLLDASGNVIDRFVESSDAERRRLAVGIKVAGPLYESAVLGFERDESWVTQSHLPAIDQDSWLGAPNEVPGGIIGVMYAPDGTTISQNPRGDSTAVFVDFNDDGGQRLANIDYDYLTPLSTPSLTFDQFLADDEPIVIVVPYLSVFDDNDARESRSNDWTTPAGYEADLTGDGSPANPGYITLNADRLHFNRYTGVVMK